MWWNFDVNIKPIKKMSSKVDEICKVVQKYSAIAFSGFLTLHLSNTIVGAVSQSLYDTYQSYLRQVYRPNWLLGRSAEYVCILTPLAVHIICGIIRMSRRSFNESKYATWMEYLKSKLSNPLQLHRYAGWVLTSIVPIHVIATRFFYPIDSDFSQVTHSMEKKPGALVMLPYYTAMLLAGVFHYSYGLNATIFKYKFTKRSVYIACGVIFALSFAGFLGMSGYLYSNIDRSNYEIWKQF